MCKSFSMRNTESSKGAVDRALELLIRLREGPIGVAEAADEFSVSRPTASRLLATMKRHGFALQDSDRRYRAGPMLDAGEQVRMTRYDLRGILHPSLAALHARINETVNIWVLDGVHVNNIDGIEADELLSIRANAWGRVPAYCSAAGKAILATFPPAAIDEMHVNGLPPWRGQESVTLPGLKRHLQTVRRRGFATNLEEASQGVFGVGVAVRTSGGTTVAGLGCGIPAVRYSSARGQMIAEALSDAAAEMTLALDRATTPPIQR